MRTPGSRSVAFGAFLSVLCGAAAPAVSANIRPVAYPTLPPMVDGAQAVVPDGWRSSSLVWGDLNRDGHKDFVLLLRDNDPALRPSKSFDTNPYMLAIYFSDGDGQYRRIASNHRLIPRHDSPELEDVIDSVTGGGVRIENNTLRVSLGLFSGTSSGMGRLGFTFRWQDGHFILIGFDSYEVNRADGSISSDSYNFLTGRRKHGVSSIDSDQTKFTWSSFARHRAPTLNEMGDGTAFDPTAQ